MSSQVVNVDSVPFKISRSLNMRRVRHHHNSYWVTSTWYQIHKVLGGQKYTRENAVEHINVSIIIGTQCAKG